MLELFGKRQQAILRLLLKHRAGLSKDQLAASLHITRTAVGQHLAGLESDGYVQRGDERKTAGRPGQTYVLTGRGAELFPRQYTWFSTMLLQALKEERGSEGLSEWLRGLAGTIASSLAPRVAGKPEDLRLAEVVRLMDELAFEAAEVPSPDVPGVKAIEASNCIYHELAQSYPEVCAFDLELLSRLTGRELSHTECMVRGGGVCRFNLPADESHPA